MDDRNIVRAVLFSAAVQISLEGHKRFGKVPGLGVTKEQFEQHIMEDAGSMIDDMVDAANIHDEDCDCEDEEEGEEEHGPVKLSTETMDLLEKTLDTLARTVGGKAVIGGDCKHCHERIMGRQNMIDHIKTCKELARTKAQAKDCADIEKRRSEV